MPNFFMSGYFMAQESTTTREGRRAAHQALQGVNATRSEIQDLRDQVERLCLLNQAMWELVSERLHLTEDHLEKKAQEVDLRDGKADGKMTTHPLRCPQCHRVSNSRHKKCLYCGMLFEGSAFG